MRIEMNVVGMSDSDALHAFVSSHMNTLKRRLNHERYHGGKFELRIRPAAQRSTGLTVGFEAEVIFSLPHTRTVVIRKTNKIAQKCVSDVLDAAEKTIRRMTEKANRTRANTRAVRKFKRERVIEE